MAYNLTDTYISDTYQRVVQIVSSSLYDGLGNLIPLNSLSGSVASSSYSITSSHSNTSVQAVSASYYGGSVISSSYSTTSSYAIFTPYIQTIGFRISTDDTYLTAGSKGYKHIGFPCNIIKTRTVVDTTGSIDINIKRNSTILGSISIVNSTGSYDAVLSGWTQQLNTDDLIEFYISGSSTHITDITIFIDIKAR